MIIKYYGYAFPQNLNIIEDVTDVLVHAGAAITSDGTLPVGPDPDECGIKNHYLFDKADELWPGQSYKSGSTNDLPGKDTRIAKFIDFTRNGIRGRLTVYGRAYVCNNDGKTIEKVDPENR